MEEGAVDPSKALRSDRSIARSASAALVCVSVVVRAAGDDEERWSGGRSVDAGRTAAGERTAAAMQATERAGR